MSAFAVLQLKNHAATEVDFGPAKIDPSTGVVTWLTAGASYDARSLATFSLQLPRVNATRVKIKAKVAIPIMDAVITTKKVDELIANVELSIPKEALLADRRNLRAYITDFLVDTVMVKALEDFENVY